MARMGAMEALPSGRDIRRYRCKLCGVVRCKRIHLRNHIVSVHGEGILAERGDDLIERDNTVSPGFRDRRKYTCHICGITRSKRVLIDNHIKAAHKKEEVREPVSQTISDFSSKEEDDDSTLFLESNENIPPQEEHDSQKYMECNPNGPLESKAMRSQHSCTKCGMTFKKPAHLRQHMLSHSDQFSRRNQD